MTMKPKYSKQRRETNQEKKDVVSSETDDRNSNKTQSPGSLHRKQERTPTLQKRQNSSECKQNGARDSKDEDVELNESNKQSAIQNQSIPRHRESRRKLFEANDHYSTRQQVLENQNRCIRTTLDVPNKHVNEIDHENKRNESLKEGVREASKRKRKRKSKHKKAVNERHEDTALGNSRTNTQRSRADEQFSDALKNRIGSKDNKDKSNDLQTAERNNSFEEDDNLLLHQKETATNKVPTTSSIKIQDQLIPDIFATLVHMKGENLSLADVIDIMRDHLHIQLDYSNPEELLFIIEQYEEKFDIVFSAGEPLISPKTDIAICPIFTNDIRKSHVCSDLHICKYFLLSKCPRRTCKFGHNLSSKHNRKAFKGHDLGGLRKDCIMILMRNFGSRNNSTLPLLCKFYNNEGKCKKGSKCMHLHMCKNFINGDCKFGKKCIRCHNIQDKQPRYVLEKYGLIPDSYKYKKIINMIRGTLYQGGVLLKRDLQSTSCTRMARRQEKNSQETPEYTSSQVTSSDESEDSSGNDSLSNIDNEYAEQELYSLSDEGEFDDSDSSLQDFQPTDDMVGHQLQFARPASLHRPKECNIPGYDCQTRPRLGYRTHGQDEMKSMMTFESQIDNKIFWVRTMNGRWQITNKPGCWADMEEGDSEELLQFHNDFISFAEEILSKAQR